MVVVGDSDEGVWVGKLLPIEIDASAFVSILMGNAVSPPLELLL